MKRYRKILRRVIWILVGLLIFFLILHTPPVKSLFKGILARTAGKQLKGRIEIGKLSYRLWRGDIRLELVELALPDMHVKAHRIEADLFAKKGISLKIDHPEVVLSPRADQSEKKDGGDGPDRPWTILERFRAVIINSGSFEWKEDQTKLLASGSIKLDRLIDGIQESEKKWILSGDLNCKLKDHPQIPASIHMSLGLKNGSFHLNTIRVDSDKNSLDAKGILHHLNPIDGNLEGKVQLESSMTEAFGVLLSVQGSGITQFQVEAGDDKLEGYVELDLPDIFVAQTGPWTLYGKAGFKNQVAEIDSFHLDGYSGSIELKGHIDIASGNGKTTILAKNLDLNHVLKTWTDAVPQLATRTGANFELFIDNWKLDKNRTKGELIFNTAPGKGLPLSGEADIGLDKNFLTFRSDRLQILNGRCSLSGSLDTKSIDAGAEFNIPATDLQKILEEFGISLPDLQLEGLLRARGKLAGDYTDLSASASVESEEIYLHSQELSLMADIEWKKNELRIQSGRIRSGPGHLEIQGTIPLGQTSKQWDLTAEIEAFNLSSFGERFGSTASADGNFSINGPPKNPVWDINSTIKFHNQKDPSKTAVFVLSAQKMGQTISILEFRADAGGGYFSASGQYRTDSGEILGKSTGSGIRLQELIVLPEQFSRLEGVLSLEGDLRGTIRSPQGRLDIKLEDLSFNGVPLTAFSLGVRLKDQRAEFRGQGPEPFLTGHCELDGAFQTHAEIDLQHIPYDSLPVMFPALQKLEDISVEGRVQIDLSLKDISSFLYHADILGIEGTFDKKNWSIDSFSFDGDISSLRIKQFRFEGAYASISIDGQLPLHRYGEMDLALDGRIDLDMFHLFIPDFELDGLAQLQLHLTGTMTQPMPAGDITITDGKGQWRGVTWENLELQIRADQKHLRIETLTLKTLRGWLKANGIISLPGSGSDSLIEFEFDHLDAGGLLDNDTHSYNTTILLNGKGSLSTTELDLSSLHGTGQFVNILTDLGDPPISLQQPFDWTLKGGHLSHSPIHLKGKETDLNISIELSTAITPFDWDIQLQGQLDAGAISRLIPVAGVSFSRTAELDLELTRKSGVLNGQASMNGGIIRIGNPPLTISNIQADIEARDNTLNITNLRGQIGTGKVEGFGEIVFEEPGTLPRADITLILDRAPLSLSKEIYALGSGEARLQGDQKGYTISGDIIIPRVLVRQEIDAKTESLSQLERQLKLLEGERSLLDIVNLNLTTQIEDVRIENSKAQLSAEGTLNIQGNLSNPELDGSISIKGGGTIQFGRSRVQITEGRVILNNYPENQLELDINGISRVSGVFIELRVQGQLDNLQTQLQAPYRSDLTQGDLVMLIMTGRTSQAAAAEAGTVAVEGLAGALGDILQEGVGESVYIDISPDQSFFSYDADPTTWFSLGKEVAPNIYVIYSQDLGSARRRGVIGYLPKELPIQIRYITEEDGRKMLEANHRLGINLGKKQDRGGAYRKSLRIHQLTFEGSTPFTEKDLQKLSKQKPGKKYNHWNALQGSERIRKRLHKLGYRGARVEFQATPFGQDQIDIHYFIESGKRIAIVWKGDKISGKIRKNIEALWDSTTPEDILAETLRMNTVYALQAEKYYLAEVNVHRTNKDEEIIIEFDVEKGPTGERLVLQFEGNEVLSDRDLREALPSTSKPRFFEALAGDASSLRDILRLRYVSEGLFQIEVSPIKKVFNEQNKEYTVTIPMEEGILTTVAELSFPQDVLDAKGPDVLDLQLSVGRPFRIEDYLHDRSAVSGFYRRKGYPDSEVTGILDPTESTVSVKFLVQKNIQPRVGKIKIAHPGKTHESVVRNAMTLKEGDTILPSELARSRKRLFDTRVYQSVDIQPVESAEGPEVQDLVVDLVEKKDVEVNYGLRYQISGPSYVRADEEETSNYSSLEIGGQLQFLNLFGRANRIGISGYLFGLQQSGRLFFETETFFGLPLSTQFYLFSGVNRELEISGLEESIQKIAFQQYYRWGENLDETRWGDKLRFQWNYSFRHIKLTPFDTNQATIDTDRGSLSLSLISDNRDSFINPTRGSFWSVSTEFARTWLGSEVNFNKLYGQGFLYVSLAENIIWASGLRLGIVPGENPLLIIEDRFKAGGPMTVRGFPLNYLGPKNEKGEPLGGQALAVFNQELRFPIYKSLYGGVFYDTGNVFLLASKARFSDLRHSAGVGLRYLLPFGPIRLDLAYILDPKAGEDRYRFVFTLGHAF